MKKEQILIKLNCPKCRLKKFASASIKFGDCLKSQDVKYLGRYKDKKLRKGSQIVCPKCKYIFRGFDIYKIISESIHK